MHTTNDFDLSLEEITKIEGSAALDLKIRNGKVADLKFRITEYKRFYTQGICGKHVNAVPQLVARVCGTCSNAHLLCSIKAIETALNITPTLQTEIMRKLAMYGLLIRDHALHLYVFSLPDILGKDTILDLDENDEHEHQLLHDTFTVKAAGNQLSMAFGGRSVHAPFITLGGFLQFPDNQQLEKTIKMLSDARPAVLRLIKEFHNCPFSFEDTASSVALNDNDYNFLSGSIHISDGRKIDKDKFRSHLEHVVIPYSHASGYKFEGDLFRVGALARMNLAKDYLHINTKKDVKESIKLFPSNNVFHNNLAQAIEILHSIDDSLEILKSNPIYLKEPLVPTNKHDGTGVGIIEAPRGTLFHRFDIQNSMVTQAEIIVPTGQNQIAIEKNLVRVVEDNLANTKENLSFEIEKFIRAYDPCMSCASHFLKIRWT